MHLYCLRVICLIQALFTGYVSAPWILNLFCYTISIAITLCFFFLCTCFREVLQESNINLSFPLLRCYFNTIFFSCFLTLLSVLLQNQEAVQELRTSLCP